MGVIFIGKINYRIMYWVFFYQKALKWSGIDRVGMKNVHFRLSPPVGEKSIFIDLKLSLVHLDFGEGKF